MRPARLEAFELDELQRPRNTLAGLFLRNFARTQAVGDVIADPQMRKHRIVLEDHPRVAPVRGQGIDPLVAEQDAAAIEFAKSGHHSQQRRFAAARRSEQREEFGVADRDRDAVDRAYAAEAARDSIDRD